MKRKHTLGQAVLWIVATLFAPMAFGQGLVQSTYLERVPGAWQAGVSMGYSHQVADTVRWEAGLYYQQSLQTHTEEEVVYPNARFMGAYAMLPLQRSAYLHTSVWLRSGFFNNGAYSNTLGLSTLLFPRGPVQMGAQLGFRKFRPTYGARLNVRLATVSPKTRFR